jgi:UDPglucose--hexose-1-phosphate uridylyltransferase
MHPRLRRDPLLGTHVLLAPERARRPGGSEAAGEDGACPFCPGNEAETPPETLALADAPRNPDTPGWSVRVVPNRYPALGAGSGVDGIHEVIVETAGHDDVPHRWSPARWATVYGVWRHRMRNALRASGVVHAMVFKNQGRGAGASLDHPHSQLVGFPFIPTTAAAWLGTARRRGEAGCIHCELVSGGEDLVVARQGGLVAACPGSPRAAFETWLMPQRHAPGFEDASPADLDALGALSADLLGRFTRCFGDRPYNIILGSAPVGEGRMAMHWYLAFVPKLTEIGGFERGCGDAIVEVLPETAARRLREAAE